MYWSELLRRSPFVNASFVERRDATRNSLRSEVTLEGPVLVQSKLPILLDRFRDLRLRDIQGKVFHSSYYRICRDRNATNITTVHDFINERTRHDFKSTILTRQKLRAVKHSKGIICVSRNTYHDLKSLVPELKCPVEIIYLGVSSDYGRISLEELSPRARSILDSARGKYLLFLGSRAKYKNFEMLVEAMRDLNGYELIIVGGGTFTNFERTFLEERLRGRYRYVGSASNALLNEIYNISHCLVYPSSYEGFGIPIGEAMRAGCPVIAAKVSSIPEVGGDSVLFMKEITANGIRESIKGLENRGLREELIEKGLLQSRKFSWEKTASETHNFYQRVWSG